MVEAQAGYARGFSALSEHPVHAQKRLVDQGSAAGLGGDGQSPGTGSVFPRCVSPGGQ